MPTPLTLLLPPACLPPCGGSGLKYPYGRLHEHEYGLPPCGGSGLKFCWITKALDRAESPSMRREWIEMQDIFPPVPSALSSPSMRREWIEMDLRLADCLAASSPSMRREWIEIKTFFMVIWQFIGLPPCGGSGLKYTILGTSSWLRQVSLHAEGVD